MAFTFRTVNLQDEVHCTQLLKLLDVYMQDEMGNNCPMNKDMAPKIIKGLKQHQTYLGFFVIYEEQYVALANCNANFSTFKGQPLINIHDFIVHPDFREQGAGKFLLDSIANYGKQNGYCRVNLEVREDNIKAQNLYKKAGYKDCCPQMFFWEHQL